MLDLSLYIILDEKYVSCQLSAIVTDICKGGASVIQLREKTKGTKKFLEDALITREITNKFNVLFIVNDRIDIALAVEADGVHLGNEDISLNYARKIYPDRIIGYSVSQVEKAIIAAKEGATYLGVGCLFPSTTKSKPLVPLSLITEIKEAVNIPVLGIGGITLERVSDVLSAGADGVCVASDIFNHPNLLERVQEFKSKIRSVKSNDKFQNPNVK
ncbi:thiamine phosphate synthase [candidate division WOR-3 bacterium]|nr:thiamine phosphate synthase [candidate division WOR-3 bacterium]